MNAKAPYTLATLSKQHSTLLPQTATVSNEFIVKFRPFDKVDIRHVERIVRLVAFDNVGWTLLLVWTGLKRDKQLEMVVS